MKTEIATHSSILNLENPTDRGAWWAAVHEVTKSRTRPSDWHFHFAEVQLAHHAIQPGKAVFSTGTECADSHWSLISGHGVPPKRHPTPAGQPPHAPSSVPKPQAGVCSQPPSVPAYLPTLDTSHEWIAHYVASRFQGPSASQRLSPPLPFTAEQYSPARADHPSFTAAPAAGHSGRALGFAGCDEQGSREHSQQASARSHSNARLTPLLKCPAVGQSCWASWTGPQQHMGFQIPPHPC